MLTQALVCLEQPVLTWVADGFPLEAGKGEMLVAGMNPKKGG